MSLVTLAVLCHNNSEHIEELLESIWKQSNTDFDVLILDNASTDKTWDLLLNMQVRNQSFRIIRLETNYGEAGGLSKIFELCDSEYVAIIHGDDVLGEGYSALVHKGILKFPKAIAITLPIVHFSDELRKPLLIGKSQWSRSKLLNRLLVCGLNPAIMPGVILNLRKANLMNIFDEPFPGRYNADIIFWTRFARSGFKISRINGNEYFYRRHPEQSSNSKDNFEILAKSRICIIEEADSVLEKKLSRATIFKEEKLFPSYSNFCNLQDYKLSNFSQSFFGSLNKFVKLLSKFL